MLPAVAAGRPARPRLVVARLKHRDVARCRPAFGRRGRSRRRRPLAVRRRLGRGALAALVLAQLVERLEPAVAHVALWIVLVDERHYHARAAPGRENNGCGRPLRRAAGSPGPRVQSGPALHRARPAPRSRRPRSSRRTRAPPPRTTPALRPDRAGRAAPCRHAACRGGRKPALRPDRAGRAAPTHGGDGEARRHPQRIADPLQIRAAGVRRPARMLLERGQIPGCGAGTAGRRPGEADVPHASARDRASPQFGAIFIGRHAI